MKVLHSVAGPVFAPFGELFDGAFASWQPGELWKSQWSGLQPGGSLAIDDTVNSKDGTVRTEAAYPNFSGQLKRVVRGQTFISILYIPVSGPIRLLWMELWRPDGPDKITLVRTAIERMLDAGIQPSDVAFDGWYYEPSFLKWLDERSLVWTTRARRNLKFYFDGGLERSPEDWAASNPMGSWHHYAERGIYAKATNVANHRLKPARLVAFKHMRHGKVDRFIITNDQRAGVRTILARYGRRWAIETVYRFTKQRLGFSTYRHLTAIAAERHVALVSLLFNFLAEHANALGVPVARLKVLAEKPTRTGSWRVSTSESVA